MQDRKPSKARNMVAKAMHECKIFHPKVLPAKKGKGKYSRKGRNAGKELSGPYFLVA